MLFLCGEDESTALRAHTHSSGGDGWSTEADRCASCTEEHGSRSPYTSSSCCGTSWTVVSAWEQRAWWARRRRWTLRCWTHRRWKLVAAGPEQKDRRPAVEAAVAASGEHAFSSWRSCRPLALAERPFARRASQDGASTSGKDSGRRVWARRLVFLFGASYNSLLIQVLPQEFVHSLTSL